jgi:hypothetical protein
MERRPHNEWIEQSARGRHAACLRKRPAGALSGPTPRAALPRSRSGPCSLLIHKLYGRGENRKSADNGT